MERWILLRKGADFEAIGKKYHISPRLACLIRNRDIIGEEEIHQYLNGTITDLYDGMLMKDMDKALDSGYPPAEFKEYMKGWNRSDVYVTMLNAYNTLKVGRSISSKLKENTICLFFSLCQSPIPTLRW